MTERCPHDPRAQPSAACAPAAARALSDATRARGRAGGRLQTQEAALRLHRAVDAAGAVRPRSAHRALERKRVIQGALMRSTIHVVRAGLLAVLGRTRPLRVKRGGGARTARTPLVISTPCASGSALSGRVWQRKELGRGSPHPRVDVLARVWPQERAPVRDVGTVLISFSWPRNGWGDEAGRGGRCLAARPRWSGRHGERGRELGRRAGDENEGSAPRRLTAALRSEVGLSARPPGCQMPAPGHRFASFRRWTPRSSCTRHADPPRARLSRERIFNTKNPQSFATWSTAPFRNVALGARRREGDGRGGAVRAATARCRSKVRDEARAARQASSSPAPRTRFGCATERMRT